VSKIHLFRSCVSISHERLQELRYPAFLILDVFRRFDNRIAYELKTYSYTLVEVTTMAKVSETGRDTLIIRDYACRQTTQAEKAIAKAK
jgi:hypothetical protein